MRRRIFPLSFLAVGILSIVYYFMAGLAGGFAASVLWVWPAAGIVLILIGLADFASQRRGGWLRVPVLILRYTICLLAVWFFAVQGLILSGMNAHAPAGADVLLVLGAQVKGEEPGIALSSRLETAYAYLTENPGTTAILCGGQGAGEEITEAECMRRYLTEHGISDERLILEERSTSTAENVRFALALAEDTTASAAIVTSHFHIYRAVRLAESCGWTTVYGEAAPFSPILTPHYMAREFLTITVDALRGNLG